MTTPCATPGCPNGARERLGSRGPVPRYCETCSGSVGSHRRRRAVEREAERNAMVESIMAAGLPREAAERAIEIAGRR